MSGLFSQTVNNLKELYDEIIEWRKVLKFKTHYKIMNLDTQGCGKKQLKKRTKYLKEMMFVDKQGPTYINDKNPNLLYDLKVLNIVIL